MKSQSSRRISVIATTLLAIGLFTTLAVIDNQNTTTNLKRRSSAPQEITHLTLERRLVKKCKPKTSSNAYNAPASNSYIPPNVNNLPNLSNTPNNLPNFDAGKLVQHQAMVVSNPAAPTDSPQATSSAGVVSTPDPQTFQAQYTPKPYVPGVIGNTQALNGMTTGLRSAALNASIAAEILAISSAPGLLPFNANNWVLSGFQGSDPSNRQTTENVNATKMYGGPIAWCQPNQEDNAIPTTIPLPYQGAKDLSGSKGTCGDFTSIKSRFETVTVNLPVEPHWNACDKNQCNCIDSDNTHFILPVSIQPNGGIQYAWKEKAADIIHITYLDPNFKPIQPAVPDIIIKGRSLGGLIAFDDGTAVLVAQIDCDGPSTADPNANMGRTMIIYYKAGSLVFARRLTDPYRAVSQTADYQEDISGNGKYVYSMDWAQLVYDPTAMLFGVYFKVTGGRGGHWGADMYQIDLTGTVQLEIFACSHDIGGRLLADPSGNYPLLCLTDGFGVERPENKGFGIRANIANETTTVSAGWSPSTMGSLVKRNVASGYVLAYSSKHTMLYYQIKFILFDNNMQPIVSLPYTLSTDTETQKLLDMEHNRIHLVPYGVAGSDQYMLYYSTTVMSTISCCTANIEERCFGTIENNFYQIVSFVGNKFNAVTAPVSYAMRMDAETSPQLYPNGDFLFAIIDNTNYPFYLETKMSITFNRVKNCPN